MRRRYCCLTIGLFALLHTTSAIGAERPDFAREILPILSNKCFVCHGPDGKAREDLRLDSFAEATADRGGYRVIDPANPQKSELLTRIESDDDPMPPADAEKQLTDEERQLLRRWIEGGGEYARHWAFVAPEKAQLPQSDSRNPIDAWVGVRLQEAGVGFAPPAARADLARRTALILTGLPPEPEHLQRFLSSQANDAYEAYVDDLLASPRYGEHQARYWLDAVRYGDTHGLHLDNRRGIYPYRDWVVKALNDNLPLDKFIGWQIAGDLLPDPTLDQLVATGYVRLNPSTGEGGAIPAEFQAKNNFDRVETLGTVFLGMSLTCARCHTHKYDPIPQNEYYSLLAYFNSTAEPAMDGNSYTYGPVQKVPADQLQWAAWAALESERDELLAVAAKAVASHDEISDDVRVQWDGAGRRDKLSMLADEAGPLAPLPNNAAAADLLARITELEKSFTTSLVAKDLDAARPTHVLRRGEYNLPMGDPVAPGVLSIMGSLPEGAPTNRLGLAAWLTSRDHPLVARVLVNRIWQRTFGHGLVRTPEDFGLQGQQPSHPRLLDWLAVELHDSGWNLKQMLRLMVTSRTYRQSSARRRDLNDPENVLFSSGPSHRLDAEVLRDIGLWASGLLDPHMGGEGVKPYQPSGMWLALAHPASNTKKYARDKGARLYRRSLYVYWKRTSPHPMMTLFDAPDRESSCVKRSRTNTSLQSLGLLNETQRVEIGRAFAQRVLHERPTDQERLDRMFELLACRKPNVAERDACTRLLQIMLARFSATPDDALSLLDVGEAPRDEELDPTIHAAWTQVAITVLASDIGILLY